ncbi:site-specific integrase [Vibrio splendidus]|uniref:site-specific integrase n=1 Tax=Vibrio splendidus TaxID=29497 RepID=UPI000C81ECFC|nr:site-specific integrase [Vibrio splendidus]PMI72787.1 integrase [Vibrio splendidus]
MASSDTKHLKLRGNVWWYQRRIPKVLLEQFGGQTTIFESLGTGDIREARHKRDILNGKLEERRFNAPNSDRHRFLKLIKSMNEDKERFPASWDEHYDLDKIQRDNDEVFIHAYTTVNGRKDHRSRYRITLKEALDNWLKKFNASQTKDTVRKVKQATDKFLKYLGFYDIQLEDITKQQVNEYIEHLQLKYKKTTVQGTISRLRSIWNYADSLGEITTRSPFEKNIYAAGEKVEKKQPFTIDEMTWIKENVATSEPDKRLLVELAVFTGCRISELCNLQVKHVIIDEDITAIYIAVGKTDAAERVIPLTDDLGMRVRALADRKQDDELLLGFDNSSEMSRWFSRIKTENISTDPAKCFHSFRVMFSTAMQQAGVEELKAAAILGHKRGNTMTYGYYSRGYELEQLKEAYDQCIERVIW